MSLGHALMAIMAVQTIGGVLGAMSAKQSADDEAEALEQQAELARQEDLEEARRLDIEHRKFLARQSVMFLKGGVVLKGSPLLILQETREEREKQVKAQKERGEARFALGIGRAARVEREGRASLVGGLVGTATSVTSMFLSGKTAGIF